MRRAKKRIIKTRKTESCLSSGLIHTLALVRTRTRVAGQNARRHAPQSAIRLILFLVSLRPMNTKSNLVEKDSEITGAFIGGPKKGVDYTKLAAEMPKIGAELEFIDQSLFEAAPNVFANTCRYEGRFQRTCQPPSYYERAEGSVDSKLNDSFGAKLDQKNQNYTVSAATVLRGLSEQRFQMFRRASGVIAGCWRRAGHPRELF